MLPNPSQPLNGKPVNGICLDHQTTWQVMLWCKGAGLTFEDFWGWCLRKDCSPARYKKYLTAWKNSGSYSVYPTFMDALLQRFYPDINVSSSTNKFQNQFDIPAGAKHIRNTETYLKSTDISPPRSVKYTLLGNPMGRNKTGCVVDYILEHGKKWRVLWITPRITLSENTMWRLGESKICAVNYKDVSKTDKMHKKLDECQFLICSIQSLFYTTDSFDLVVIDEPETVFATFNGNAKTHHDKMTQNWSVFVGHLQNAQKVILMDAFTTKTSLNVIKGVIRLSDTHISNHYEVVQSTDQPTPRQFLEMETFDDWMVNLMQRAEKGEKLYIFTPFKNGKYGVAAITETLQNLMGWNENKEIFAYYAEKEQEKKKLSDAEKIWGAEQCRCVVTNGTISVGVNFDRKNVFDKIFGFYAPFLPVRDFIQALSRVRHPKSSAMILYRENCRTYGFERNRGVQPNCQIYQQMMQDLQVELNANDNTKNWETFNMFCQNANILIYPIQMSTATLNNSRYIDLYAKKCELVFAWNRIDDIDSKTATILQIKNYNTEATLDDRLQLEKYFFKRKFLPETPEDAMDEIWTKKKDIIDRIIELRMRWETSEEVRDDGRHDTRDDLMIKIFKDNKVAVGAEFPKRMDNKIPLDVIQANFHFDRPIKNTQTGVVAQMINAFFGMKAYSWSKQRKQEDKQRAYEYETSDTYLDLSKKCMEYGQIYEGCVRVDDLMLI
ncbi:hypothetical protein DFS34DRAFT_673121 [Phlyctochytrium arcticum]|nr:hypothetical protein DFS34DRAFT_673121 [Phlyctochytrium arcticum]